MDYKEPKKMNKEEVVALLIEIRRVESRLLNGPDKCEACSEKSMCKDDLDNIQNLIKRYPIIGKTT